MRAEIIRIGNSRGLRIPKAVLEQCGMKRAVNLQVTDHTLIVTPCEETRAGWSEAFQLMDANNEDLLLDTDSMAHSWDDEEWQW
jgi:antitoxin MazE